MIYWSIAWAIVGILGWGWANHCIQVSDPDENNGLAKWIMLVAAPFLGPFMLLINLIVYISSHTSLSFGLRFK